MTRGQGKKLPLKTRQKVTDSKGVILQNGTGNIASIRMEETNYIAVQIILNILDHAEPDIKEKLKYALETYLNTLLTDKNHIPLELILTPEDFLRNDTIPLPAVFTKLDVVYRLPISNQDLGEANNEHGD